MKKTTVIAILMLSQMLFANLRAQTMKYKEIYSLIKEGKIAEALPHLITYLKEEPKHTNGSYWAGKIFYDKAIANKSSQQADSSILYFKLALQHLTEMDINPLNASKFPDFTGADMKIKYDNGKVWMQGKITEMEALKVQIAQAQVQQQKANDVKASSNQQQAQNVITPELIAENKRKWNIRRDSLIQVIIKQQKSLEASNPCPNCAENGAKEFVKEMIVKCDKESKDVHSGHVTDALKYKGYWEEALKANKYIPYYLSNTKAYVHINYTSSGIGTARPICLIKNNNKWVGVDKNDDAFFNLRGQDQENYPIWIDYKTGKK